MGATKFKGGLAGFRKVGAEGATTEGLVETRAATTKMGARQGADAELTHETSGAWGRELGNSSGWVAWLRQRQQHKRYERRRHKRWRGYRRQKQG